MKKIAIISMMLIVLSGMAWANDIPQPVNNKDYIPLEAPQHLKTATISQTRSGFDLPEWEFIQEPTTLSGLTSYYDYMPGSYCGRPLMTQPDQYGGVYFVFHGRPNTTDNRRVYWAYVHPDGSTEYATITTSDTWQGYPGMTMHPASGDPIASWHDIMGAATPEDTNTRVSFDDYGLLFIPGFWKTPVTFDQPIPYVDEYIWPYMYIGMAPDYEITGNYRVYQISGQNPDGEIEHDILRWIDVPQDTYVYGDLDIMLDKTNWSDPVNISRDWSDPAAGISCRPYPSFAVDPFTPGHVAIFGYAGYTYGLVGGEIVPQGFYVWDSYDGGETWDYANFHSYETDVGMYNEYVMWAVDNVPGFVDDNSIPYDELHVWIGWPGNQHSTHRTATFDSEGNLHLPELFWISYVDDDAGSASYWPYYLFQYEVEVVYKADGSWEIREVPALPGVDAMSGRGVPWEIEAATGDTLIYPWLDMPFTDITTVGFHENTQRNAACLTQPWMVQVWDSGTKVLYAENAIPGYDDYATHPIFHVSATRDNGENWSVPIELSDIYSTVYPGFADMITMYPYINPTIKDLGDGWGQIDMYFFDDNDYGSFIQQMGPNTGGELVYCSFKINFAGLEYSNDPSQPQPEASLTLRNVPNPFFESTKIQFSSSVGVKNATVTIYNTKGQLVKTIDGIADSPTAGYAYWDGTDNQGNDVANGIYLYKVETNGASIAKKMMLNR
ncbi:MAG TPA: T9SS type A sorting domain-containing protein [Candidatus Cloacimonetes bacterium]|nr:T9SS type A sorting domain-containing protein [Candidatus Cloacimonadota bacterium]HEX38147.1 T9SS type A sorting domain-containing protein [Candidatus Cloacimonadota bacterium]